ncbi:MAG: type II secretion system protein M [Nitrospinae bacterium]|nr:type II secretion system protein M [Nitrospinota bacterium]
MNNLAPRDRKFLLGGGIFVVCYVLFVFVIQPVYGKHKRIDRQIQDKIQFIQKYYEVLNQKSFYEQKSSKNKTIHTALGRRFLSEAKPALAAASLQSLLEGLARQTGVNIVRVKVDKPKYTERLLAVSTKITVRSTLRNLTRFVQKIEGHEKFLVIEKMTAQRNKKSDPEELQTQLTVSGFIQQMEEKDSKAI